MSFVCNVPMARLVPVNGDSPARDREFPCNKVGFPCRSEGGEESLCKELSRTSSSTTQDSESAGLSDLRRVRDAAAHLLVSETLQSESETYRAFTKRCFKEITKIHTILLKRLMQIELKEWRTSRIYSAWKIEGNMLLDEEVISILQEQQKRLRKQFRQISKELKLLRCYKERLWQIEMFSDDGSIELIKLLIPVQKLVNETIEACNKLCQRIAACKDMFTQITRCHFSFKHSIKNRNKEMRRIVRNKELPHKWIVENVV